jgi:hypothetical protein
MRLETAHHFLKSRGRVGFQNWCCSEVFAFGVNPTEMILGRSGGGSTIQFTGGRSAYKVVDEAS